jgi:hypothetical protein
MGAFSSWQARYEECGLVTFPVRIAGKDKKPAVSNYHKAGARASREWAARFPNADAFAFLAGPRSRVTVLDVDTSDERVLADALDRHGQTPIVVSTGSGNRQAWFRHNGEGRQIRPDPSRPIDILGGGVVVAPPSSGGRSPYQFIQGSLDDLDHLPAMREAKDLPQAESAARKIGKGSRNAALLAHLRAQANYCDTLDDLTDIAHGFANEALERNDGHAFTDAEIKTTAKSVWEWTEAGHNFVGKGRRLVKAHDDIDRIMALGSDAYFLHDYLRRRFWHAVMPFNVPNAMADEMPGGAWTRKRFTLARSALIEAGEIEELRKASSYHGAALYRWPG